MSAVMSAMAVSVCMARSRTASICAKRVGSSVFAAWMRETEAVEAACWVVVRVVISVSRAAWAETREAWIEGTVERVEGCAKMVLRWSIGS